MLKIAIPYYTGSGHTERLAAFVKEGALNIEGLEVALLNVENGLNEEFWESLHESDAIIFGSPTYMGSVAGAFKSFMDETSRFWVSQKWSDKIAAGFTIGTLPSGDKLNTLIQMAVFSAQHGMIWVGQNHVGSRYTKDSQSINESGSWLGFAAQSDSDKSKLISENDIASARFFGERVAKAALRWSARQT